MRYYIVLFILLCMSCTESTSYIDNEIEINIESGLKNINGYFIMNVDTSYSQTFHKISANITGETIRVIWSADTTWKYNHIGLDFNVPIINKFSYVSDGIAYTIFAPVKELIGDTVKIVAATEGVSDSIYVILH